MHLINQYLLNLMKYLLYTKNDKTTSWYLVNFQKFDFRFCDFSSFTQFTTYTKPNSHLELNIYKSFDWKKLLDSIY